MKRLALLVLSAAMLAACAPRVTGDPALQAALAAGQGDPATFTLASGPQRALLAVGAKEAYLDRIDITGGALRLNDDRCKAPETTLVRCTYGGLLVPGGGAFGQGVNGDVLHGTVWYHRTPDGPELAKQF